MKPLLMMTLLMLAGTVGAFAVSPVLGVGVYYLLSILRPQFMWEWALPPDAPWSFYVAVAAMLASLLGAGSGSEDASRRFTRAHAAVLLFGAWVGVSYLTALDREAAAAWSLEYLKIFLMFGVSLLAIRTVKHIWLLFCMAALVLGYISYEINYLYLVNGYLGIQRNGYGGFDNNVAGLMLAMGVPLCYFAWEGSRSRFRWGFLMLVPVILHAVLMTYSRGAMVSLLAAAPLIGLRSRHRKQVALVGVGLLVMLPFLAGPQIRERFFTISTHQTDESAQSRRQSWAAGFEIACDHPVFGVGPRNANLLSRRYGADMEGRTIHSLYLQIAADNGLVGLGLYLTAVALVWTELRRARQEAARHRGAGAERVHALTGGIETALLVFLVGGLFLSLEIFELPYLLMLLAAQLKLLSCPAESHIGVIPRVSRVLLPASPA